MPSIGESSVKPPVEIAVLGGACGVFWCFAHQLPLHDGGRHTVLARLTATPEAVEGDLSQARAEVVGFDDWWTAASAAIRSAVRAA